MVETSSPKTCAPDRHSKRIPPQDGRTAYRDRAVLPMKLYLDVSTPPSSCPGPTCPGRARPATPPAYERVARTRSRTGWPQMDTKLTGLRSPWPDKYRNDGRVAVASLATQRGPATKCPDGSTATTWPTSSPFGLSSSSYLDACGTVAPVRRQPPPAGLCARTRSAPHLHDFSVVSLPPRLHFTARSPAARRAIKAKNEGETMTTNIRTLGAVTRVLDAETLLTKAREALCTPEGSEMDMLSDMIDDLIHEADVASLPDGRERLHHRASHARRASCCLARWQQVHGRLGSIPQLPQVHDALIGGRPRHPREHHRAVPRRYPVPVDRTSRSQPGADRVARYLRGDLLTQFISATVRHGATSEPQHDCVLAWHDHALPRWRDLPARSRQAPRASTRANRSLLRSSDLAEETTRPSSSSRSTDYHAPRIPPRRPCYFRLQPARRLRHRPHRHRRARSRLTRSVPARGPTNLGP